MLCARCTSTLGAFRLLAASLWMRHALRLLRPSLWRPPPPCCFSVDAACFALPAPIALLVGFGFLMLRYGGALGTSPLLRLASDAPSGCSVPVAPRLGCAVWALCFGFAGGALRMRCPCASLQMCPFCCAPDASFAGVARGMRLLYAPSELLNFAPGIDCAQCIPVILPLTAHAI